MEFATEPFSFGLGLVLASYIAGMAVSAVFNVFRVIN